MSVLVLKDVSKSYWRGKLEIKALRDVSLTVGEAEFVVVTGPSGSGKSTMLNVIAGVDGPDVGSVRISGEDIGAYGPAERAHHSEEELSGGQCQRVVVATHDPAVTAVADRQMRLKDGRLLE